MAATSFSSIHVRSRSQCLNVQMPQQLFCLCPNPRSSCSSCHLMLPPYSVATDEKKDADLSSVVIVFGLGQIHLIACHSSSFKPFPFFSQFMVYVQQENPCLFLGTWSPPLSLPNRRLRFRVEESKGEGFSSLHPRSQVAVPTHSDMFYEEETTRPTLFSFCLANFASSISHSPF